MSGYGLMKSIKEKTGKRPSPGSIYPVLEGLKSAGSVTVKDLGRLKKYRITPQGRAVLSDYSQHREVMMEKIKSAIGVFCTMTGQTEEECLSSLHEECINRKKGCHGKG